MANAMRFRVVGLFIVAIAVCSAPALAATIEVTSTADELIAGNRECTQREAIANANANGDSDSTGLWLQSEVTLRGAGAQVTVIDADGGDVAVGNGGSRR